MSNIAQPGAALVGALRPGDPGPTPPIPYPALRRQAWPNVLPVIRGRQFTVVPPPPRQAVFETGSPVPKWAAGAPILRWHAGSDLVQRWITGNLRGQ